MKEIEMKAHIPGVEPIRKKLETMATWVKEEEKYDRYFAKTDIPLKEIDFFNDPLFRLRKKGNQYVVTYKRKKIEKGLEINDEIEFGIDDAVAFENFAAYLGFSPVMTKEKKSIVFRLDELSIELNDVAHLGAFIEVEHLSQTSDHAETIRQKIKDLFQKLDIPPEAIESRLYLDLLREKMAT